MKKQGKGPLVQRLRPQARFGAQPLKAALSAQMGSQPNRLTEGLLQPLRPCGAPPLTQGRLGVCVTMTLLVLSVLLSCVAPAFATEGNVLYTGDVGAFIFEPGSEHSPTDLFPNFKDVMPGDSITQPITVKNDASNKVKVKIYMRSLGAHDNSVEFLSQLRLRVEKSEDNTMAYMFDAAASETAQLTGWVCLGTLYSGGEVNLNVILDVPVELDNAYQQQIGYLDWEFMIEEYEIAPTDPEPPKTGDDAQIFLWTGLMLMSLCALIILLFVWKRKEKEEQ